LDDSRKIIGKGLELLTTQGFFERKHEQISFDIDHLLMDRRRKFFRMGATG